MKTKINNKEAIRKAKGAIQGMDGAIQVTKGAIHCVDGAIPVIGEAIHGADVAIQVTKGAIRHPEGAIHVTDGAIQMLCEKEKALNAIILNIIVMALAPTRKDFIPGSDGDFDEWQKNFISRLSGTWSIGGGFPVLREYLNIPDADWFPVLAENGVWVDKFAKGGKKVDRKPSDTTAKIDTRVFYEKMLRDFVGEFIRKKKKATNDIKRALGCTVPDTEPSPVHSTDAPVTALKNKGGSIIDFHNRHTTDQTRPSMLGNYLLELRFKMGTVTQAPVSFDDVGLISTLSSKAHFAFTAGGANIGKVFYCYARWKHLRKAEFDGPFSNLIQIMIA